MEHINHFGDNIGFINNVNGDWYGGKTSIKYIYFGISNTGNSNNNNIIIIIIYYNRINIKCYIWNNCLLLVIIFIVYCFVCRNKKLRSCKH